MKELFSYLDERRIRAIGKKLSSADLTTMEKKLEERHYPPLPADFKMFLRHFNGICEGESVILGYFPTRADLDLSLYNEQANERPETLILGYDDLAFLLYDDIEKKYLLIDKATLSVVEEFRKNELELALSSMIH